MSKGRKKITLFFKRAICFTSITSFEQMDHVSTLHKIKHQCYRNFHFHTPRARVVINENHRLRNINWLNYSSRVDGFDGFVLINVASRFTQTTMSFRFAKTWQPDNDGIDTRLQQWFCHFWHYLRENKRNRDFITRIFFIIAAHLNSHALPLPVRDT